MVNTTGSTVYGYSAAVRSCALVLFHGMITDNNVDVISGGYKQLHMYSCKKCNNPTNQPIQNTLTCEYIFVAPEKKKLIINSIEDHITIIFCLPA